MLSALTSLLLLVGLACAIPIANNATRIPTTGGRTTIMGSGFFDNPIFRVDIGSDECTELVVVNDGTLTCRMSAGVGGRKRVSIHYRQGDLNRISSRNNIFGYEVPRVDEAVWDENAGVITITGNNFGTNLFSITTRLFLNATTESPAFLCRASTMLTTHSKYECTPPAGWLPRVGQFYVLVIIASQRNNFVDEATVTNGNCYDHSMWTQLRTDSILFHRAYSKVVKRTKGLLAKLKEMKERLPAYAGADSCCGANFVYNLDLATVGSNAMEALRFADCLEDFCDDVDDFAMLTASP